MDRLEELKKEYWKVLARTRKSGRISQGVKDKEEARWGKFDGDVVMEALRIHISRYPEYKETYTRGIMKNLAQKKERTGKAAGTGMRHGFEQNKYDFDALEKALLDS